MSERTAEEEQLVKRLGLALKKARLAANQTHEEFASRVGVSRWTIAEMERGNPRVGIGTWVAASRFLGLLETWDGVFALPENPFEAYDRARQDAERLAKSRARRKKA